MLQVQIDVDLLDLNRVLLAAHMRVAFAPKTERAHIDELDIRIPVVSHRRRGQERVQLLQEHRVVEKRIPRAPFVHPAFPDLIERPLRARLLHPLRRRIRHPILRTRQTQRNPLPLRNPPLRRRIQNRPIEHSLLRFDIGPRNPQVDRRQSREIVHRIRRRQLRPIVRRDVRIEMHRPPHPRIHQRRPRILRPNHHAIIVPGGGRRGGRGHRKECQCICEVVQCLHVEIVPSFPVFTQRRRTSVARGQYGRAERRVQTV